MTAKPRPFLPRLRTILLAANLLVLLLPLGSIYLLRIYENELIRQTEAELYVQGAFIAAAYKAGLLEELAARGMDPAAYGRPLDLAARADDEEYYRPIPAHLDLTADPILPPQSEPVVTLVRPDPAAAAAAAELEPVMEEAQRTTLAGIRLTDHRGLVIASSGGDRHASLADTAEIRSALSGRTVSFIRQRVSDEPPPPLASISRGTGIRIFAAMPVVWEGDAPGQARVFGAVQLSRTPSNILKALHAKRRLLIAAGLGLVAVALGLALVTSLTITRPVNALIRQTRSISRGGPDPAEPLKRPMTREIALLSEAFARMARDVEHRTGYIRNFAMHVSHEFKTPLTAIQGAVELLQSHMQDMAPERRQRFLHNISQDADRLSRLVARLLELARADVFEPTTETADLAGVLQSMAETWREKGLGLEIQGAGPVRVKASAEVLELVAGHLLDNSLRHGADVVAVRLENDGPMARASFTDNGAGVSGANAAKVFTPFFTTGRDSGGTGLGLTIVRSLLAAHGGTVELQAREPGATFMVSLPLAGQEDRFSA